MDETQVAAVGAWFDSVGAGCGSDWKACGRHGLGNGLKAWAAQVRQQAGTQAGRQADQAGRQCAAGADWALWLGAAEQGLRQGGPAAAYGQVSPGKGYFGILIKYLFI